MATVLIADDERNIRKSLQTTLHLEGYEVETVSDGSRSVYGLTAQVGSLSPISITD